MKNQGNMAQATKINLQKPTPKKYRSINYLTKNSKYLSKRLNDLREHRKLNEMR